MTELYFWGSTFVVGLLLLKLVPAEKLARANRKMRERLPGFLVVIMYIIIGGLFTAGSFLLLSFLGAPTWVTYVITGALVGAFIGLIPLIDPKHSK